MGMPGMPGQEGFKGDPGIAGITGEISLCVVAFVQSVHTSGSLR